MLTLHTLLRSIVQYRSMILALAMRDLRSKFVGTMGGWFWIFAHPISVVIVFYFVFAIGFKAKGPSSTPFILWFVCGLVPWMFFNGSIIAITNSITSNLHLVKKTIFPTEIFPLVHLTSELITHGIFLLILFGMFVFFGLGVHPERILFLYFTVCACALLLGLGWMLSALQVFYRDVTQGLTIFLNLLFWATPIVWSQEMLPPQYLVLVHYNPIYYIVEGYRGALIYEQVLWPSAWSTLYFWSLTSIVFFTGSYVFRRLKPEFADI